MIPNGHLFLYDTFSHHNLQGQRSPQRKLVFVPGSVLITWLSGVKKRDEWSERWLHHHMAQLAVYLLLAVVLRLFPPPTPPTERLHGVHSQSVTSTWGCERLQAWGCSSSHHAITPSLLFKYHCQVHVTLGEVFVTLWIWDQPTVPRIHPSRAFFVLVCHSAAMLSVCKDHSCPVSLCLSGGWKESRWICGATIYSFCCKHIYYAMCSYLL